MSTLSRLVIHIGMPKTGSTAIQNVLAANREILAPREIYYPEAATRGNAHHPIAWSASLERRPRDDVVPLAETLELLTEELDTQRGTAILSSEALFHLPSPEIARIIEWSDRIADSTIVIVYVRPPASFHEGWYRQLVKTSGYGLTFEEHLRQAPVVQTGDRLQSITELVGRSRLIVRPYMRENFVNGDVVRDFCDELGIDTFGFHAIEAQHLNPSLDADLVEFKVRLHKLGVGHSPRLSRALVDWSMSRHSPVRSLFTSTTWDRFVTRTEPGHRALLERYDLPADLVDRQPEEFSSEQLSEKQFADLLEEFGKRLPTLAKECVRAIGDVSHLNEGK